MESESTYTRHHWVTAAGKAKGTGAVCIKYSSLLGDGLDFHATEHICLLVHVFGSIPVYMYMQVKYEHTGCYMQHSAFHGKHKTSNLNREH